MELTPEQVPPAVRIAVRGLTIDYPGNSDAERHTALENVSLDVHQGEFLCVVGPSGCGKSTLIGAIAGFLPPKAGTMTLDGRLIDYASIRQAEVLVKKAEQIAGA